MMVFLTEFEEGPRSLLRCSRAESGCRLFDARLWGTIATIILRTAFDSESLSKIETARQETKS